MTRVYCQHCQRPKIACICAFIANVINEIHVIVLQHPSEIAQSKGTVSLLQRSLTKCDVLVGENFTDNRSLTKLLSIYAGNVALLFPSEKATEINFSVTGESTTETIDTLTCASMKALKCIIILDGTWKKAYRLFMVNPFLNKIQHLVLPEGIESNYHIRKTKRANALSSLEACCHALARLENNREKYQPLLDGFVKFNLFQQSFMLPR